MMRGRRDLLRMMRRWMWRGLVLRSCLGWVVNRCNFLLAVTANSLPIRTPPHNVYIAAPKTLNEPIHTSFLRTASGILLVYVLSAFCTFVESFVFVRISYVYISRWS